MKINCLESSGVLIYRVSGSITFENYDQVVRELDYAREKGMTNIIINWQEVVGLDTSGLQTLVALIRGKKKDPSFNFSLVTNKPAHLKLINLCGFDKMIKIYPTEERALKDLAAKKTDE